MQSKDPPTTRCTSYLCLQANRVWVVSCTTDTTPADPCSALTPGMVLMIRDKVHLPEEETLVLAASRPANAGHSLPSTAKGRMKEAVTREARPTGWFLEDKVDVRGREGSQQEEGVWERLPGQSHSDVCRPRGVMNCQNTLGSLPCP